MVAAMTGAAAVIWSQPISGTDRTAQGFLGDGLGAWPRWNITASSPNNGVLNDFGACAVFGGDSRPELFTTAEVVVVGEGVGCAAGDHTDLRDLGPHLVDLEPVEAQTCCLQTEPGSLDWIAIADMASPLRRCGHNIVRFQAQCGLHRGEVRECPCRFRCGQPGGNR